MRIALVSPLYEAVPPILYGGTERVIAALAGELARRGHDVTLFAAGGSDTPATLVEASESPLRFSMTRPQLEQIAPHLHLQMLADVYSRADEFDIVHAHTDIWTLPFAQSCTIPTVVTMHGRLDLEVVRTILPMYAETPLGVDQRSPAACRGRPPPSLDGHVSERARPVRVLRHAEPAGRRLSRLRGADHAGEATRLGGRGGTAGGPTAACGGEDRSARRRLLAHGDRAPVPVERRRLRRRDRRGGEARRSSPGPPPRCSRSTGPNRSGW